jgi:hypothetical protein
MVERIRPLEFTEGFVGPPVPRTKTGNGCPEWQNLCLTPEGTSLMPMPGWRRTYPYKLNYKPFVGLRDVAGVRATGDIQFSATPAEVPHAADTITIKDGAHADNVYEFYTGTYSGSNFGVLIGANVTATLYNLRMAISDNDTLGIVASVVVADNKLVVTAREPGTAGNGITMVESTNHVTVDAALTGGVDDEFVYTWYETLGAIPGTETNIAGKYLVVVFPPQALLTNGGQGVGVVDQATGRVVALAFHPGGPALDPTNAAADRIPRVVGHLNRQGAHDYPKLVSFKDLTFVISAWDEVRVWDGAELRLAGVRAPQTAPGIALGSYTAPVTEYVWAGLASEHGTPPPPVNVDAADMVLSTGHVATEPCIKFGAVTYAAEGYGHPGMINVKIPWAENKTGELCYANGERACAETTKRVIAVELWYESNRSHHDKILPPRTLSLVVGNSVASGAIGQGAGTTVTYPIVGTVENGQEIGLKERRVYPIDLPFEEDWVTLQAFGWRLEKTIPASHFSDSTIPNPTDDLQFRFRLVYKSVSGQGLLAEGEYLMGFSWFDRKRNRESNVSPYGIVNLGSSTPVAVDLTGSRGGLEVGMTNANPDPRHVDAVRVYLHKTDWGTDSYGYPQMRLYQEFDMPPEDESGQMWVYISAERDISDVAVDKEPEYERGMLPPAIAAVVDGERLMLANEPSYSVGKVFNPQVSQTMYKARAWKTAAGLVCYANTTADPSGKTFTVSPFWPDWWYVSGTPTEQVWCESDPSGLTFVAYPEETPEWGPWLEGREIRFGTSGDKFLIVKALPNATGEYDRLWVYRAEVDGAFSSFAGPFNEAVRYEITGRPNRLTWSAALPGGPYIEGTAQAGYQDLEMPGDEILALGRVGDFLAAVGRTMTVFLRQISGVVDGSSNPQNPFPGPRAVRGGAVSGRSLVEIGNRQALFLSPEGKLMAASVEGVSEHPLSARFMGWITSQYRVDANMLRHCHAVWDPVRNWYVLFLGDSGIGPAGTDLTDKRGDWPDAAPLDRFVEWEDPV